MFRLGYLSIFGAFFHCWSRVGGKRQHFKYLAIDAMLVVRASTISTFAADDVLVEQAFKNFNILGTDPVFVG